MINMKNLSKFLVAIGASLTLMGGVASVASADELNNPNGDKVCQPQDAHIDGQNRKVITETIQDGLLITGYCVKAGSIKNGHGPHYVTLDEPTKTVEITHPSGKQISHYVVFWRPIPPFSHDWEYADPTCDWLHVDYPANLPNPQNANHVNIRISSNGQTVTLNWHTSGTWAPASTFVYADHPQWPGFSVYTVEWVQVAESNYHWSGSLECGTPPTTTTVPPTTVPPTTVPPTTVPPTTVPPTTVPPTTVPPVTCLACDLCVPCPPETTVPETTVPETTVPETTVPETTVPETTVPETTVPETTVPETTVPETTAPETTAPETTVPVVEDELPKTGLGATIFWLGFFGTLTGLFLLGIEKASRKNKHY